MVLSSGTPSGDRTLEVYVSRYEKKMKDKLDDEIKLAPEELEKHMILNSNRLRTFEDARLEVVTYVEAKFGLRIRDSKPSCGHSDPTDVDAVNSLSLLPKEKDHRVRVMGILSAVEHIFTDTAVHARAQASNRLAKANRASRDPRAIPHSQAKARVETTMGNPKENPKEPKVRTKAPKAYTRAKHRKLVSQVLKTRNRRQARTFTNLHRHAPLILPGTMVGTVTNGTMAGVLMWNDDWISVGWHESWEQAYDTSASSCSFGGLQVSATSSPKRFEWVKMNLDTGAAMNTFPLNFGPEGAGDGRYYRTASGERIPYGEAWQFYDENGLLRSLNGRLTALHKVLCSAAEIACKGRQDFYLGHHGGYMFPIHCKIGQGMRILFEKLVNWHGKNELIPFYLENNIFNFYLNREIKSTETNNVNDDDHCLANNCQQSGNGDGRAVRS